MAVKKEHLFSGITVLVSTIAGLLLFNRESFHNNEGSIIAMSRLDLLQLLSPMPIGYSPDHQPLFALILKLWNLLTWPATRLSMRFLVLIFYLLAVLFIYLWANNRRIPPQFSCWLALITAMNVYILDNSLYIRMYGMYLFLAMASLYCFDRIIARETVTGWDLHLFFLVTLTGVLTFYFQFYIFFLQLLFLAFHPAVTRKHKKIFWSWSSLLTALFLVKLPYIYQWRFHDRPHSAVSDSAIDMARYVLSPFFGALSSDDLDMRPTLILFLYAPLFLLLVIQFGRSWKKGGIHRFYPLLFLSSLGLILLLKDVFRLDEISIRYIIYIIPLFWFFIVAFLAELRFAPIAHLVLGIILLANISLTSYWWRAKQHTDMAPIVAGLVETIPPGEKVVCNGVNFEWYINVYSNPARNNYSEYAELDSFLKEPPDPGQVYFGIVNEKRDYLEERLAQAGIRYRILRKNYFTTNNYPNSYAFYRLDIL